MDELREILTYTDKEELKELFNETDPEKIIALFFADVAFIVDMPYVGKGKRKANSQGWK